MIAFLCTLLVGGAFLFSAFVKAVDGGSFARDLARYRLAPQRWLLPGATVLAGLEAALGAALVLHVYPQVLVPAGMVVVASLAGLTLWGEQARDLDDCGCYGGVVLLTPKQSAFLDAGYLVLLGAALLWPAAGGSWAPLSWGVGFAVLVGAAAGTAAWRSRTEPLLDLSRLREGRRWKTRWLPVRPDLTEAPHFVVFLSKDCPYCKRWVPLLNVMNTQPDFPDVLGVMSVTDEERDAFRREHLIRFPVEQMDDLLFGQMVSAYPTAVLVEEGAVAGKWSGEFPQPYFQRVRQFFEGVREASAGAASPAASGGFGG